MKDLYKGQRVEHEELGEGTVIAYSAELDQVEIGFSELETITVSAQRLMKSMR